MTWLSGHPIIRFITFFKDWRQTPTLYSNNTIAVYGTKVTLLDTLQCFIGAHSFAGILLIPIICPAYKVAA